MYTIESRVRYSECDEHGCLSLTSLINYLQDCTTFHSEDIGRGVAYMQERGIAWLIAAWQIEIVRLPRFCDHIRVNTWCHDMARTLASRNFTICDHDGSELVRADSLWFIYDFKAARPVRIPPSQMVYLDDAKPLDMPKTQRRLSIEGQGTAMTPVVVSEEHLDTNRHVNNAQYLGMAMAALTEHLGPSTSFATTDISRICIQYKQQALLGDVIVPIVYGDSDVRTISLSNGEGDPYAVVRLELNHT